MTNRLTHRKLTKNKKVLATTTAAFVLTAGWTDLDGDGAFGAGDTQRFDAETARALARMAYLAAQGVE